jgi:serine/threonine protein kinase
LLPLCCRLGSCGVQHPAAALATALYFQPGLPAHCSIKVASAHLQLVGLAVFHDPAAALATSLLFRPAFVAHCSAKVVSAILLLPLLCCRLSSCGVLRSCSRASNSLDFEPGFVAVQRTAVQRLPLLFCCCSCCAADFGLAVFYDPAKLPLTDLGLEGTPWYMSPEVTYYLCYFCMPSTVANGLHIGSAA